MFYNNPDLFDKFHPLEAEAPKLFRAKLKNILVRARKIVIGKSLEELKQALQFITCPDGIDFETYHINKYKELHPELNTEMIPNVNCSKGQFNEAMREYHEDLLFRDYEKHIRKDEGYSDVADFILTYEQYDIDYKTFPDANWSYFFAVMAIGKVALIVVQLEEYSNVDNPVEGKIFMAADLMAEGYEAICHAEYLEKARHEARSHIKQLDSEKGRSKSNLRHNAANKIKEEFVQAFLNSNESAIAPFARSFYEQLSTEHRTQICPTRKVDNAVRTLREYLAKYKKENNIT